MTTEKKTIKVAMSERSPLKIDPEIWPLIAEAKWHDGEHAFQANYVRWIKVREHADGRRLVYGVYDSGPGGCWQGFRGSHGGFLVENVRDEKREPREINGVNEWLFSDEDGTVRAVRRVAGIIGDDGLADECIADLPAEELA